MIVPSGLMLTLLVLLAGAPARGLMPAVLMDGELSPQAVTLASIDGQRVRYFDAQRVMRERDLAEVVRLTLHSEAGQASAAGGSAYDEGSRPARFYVQLVDGQRLVGTLSPDAADHEEVMWLEHPRVGRLRLPLERVAWIQRSADVPTPGPATPTGDPFGWLARRSAGDAPGEVTQDRLWLANGDVLTGFVVEITGEQVVFEPADAEGKPVDLPWDRVEGVALANPAMSPLPPAGRDRVSLRDGSVLHSEPVRADGSAVYLRPTLRSTVGNSRGTQPVGVPAEQVHAIDLGRGGRCVLAWSELAWETVAGGEAYGLPVSARVVNTTLTLSAPITVEATLPGDLLRVAGTLRWPPMNTSRDMPRNTPRAGVEGRLAAQKHLLTVRLNNDRVSEAFNAPAAGRVLRLSASAGPQGPSRSALACEDAWVLLAQPDPASPDVLP